MSLIEQTYFIDLHQNLDLLFRQGCRPPLCNNYSETMFAVRVLQHTRAKTGKTCADLMDEFSARMPALKSSTGMCLPGRPS